MSCSMFFFFLQGLYNVLFLGHLQGSFSFTSKNPVLKNITDYLVEEGSFEEEELLGTILLWLVK